MVQPRLLSRSPALCSRRCYATAATSAQTGLISRPPIMPTIRTKDTKSKSKPPPKFTENGTMWKYTPRTPGLRWLQRPINLHLHKGKPLRELTFPKMGIGKGGRNNTGRVCVRHRGGGHRRRIRTVDFYRMRPGEHEVVRIEYDPNRSAHLALLKPVDPNSPANIFKVGKGRHAKEVSTQYSYVIAAEGMRAGDRVQSFRAGIPQSLIDEMGGVIDPGMLAAKTAFRGNCLPLHLVPTGTQVFNVGIQPNGPAVFCRSAGTSAIVVAKEEGITDEDGTVKPYRWVQIKLQSGEVRRVHKDACATIGVASNPHWQFRMLGKAGRSRWLNIRPTVRGMAMNACDHPHGGGRGKSKGKRIPVSPWGTPAKSGYKTRPKRRINKFLVHERPRNQGRRRNKQG
ncbi:ribosomal protein L2 [Verruconis gallopava]|uniref:Large ribosomal subunit protein uL2m n=1 Tax=Verruconis gallopava TaxID=253628 RepID=A0A0D1XVP6_9PEZI|nr:ribosomal protein L2 [Verruconis gallopava]KIW06861.1 ribosomal protein L2 [Verruconis gallopava]